MNDKEAIQLIRAGDESWIRYCYELLRTPFIKWIVKQTFIDESDAQEIFQASLVVLYENVHKANFELTSTLKTYFYSIGKNKAMEYTRYRSKRQNLSVKEFTLSYQDETDTLIEFDQRISIMQQAIQNLGEPCYSLLKLFYYEKLSWVAIASRMDYSSENSAKNMKLKCLQRVRGILKLS